MQVNTNENTLIAKIVGLVTALVIVGMILVPVVSDAEKDTMISMSPYTLRMSEIGDETVVLSYNETSFINGESPNYTNSAGTQVTDLMVVSDSFIITTNGAFWYYYFGYEGTDVQIYTTSTGAATAVATIGNGVMNLVINETTSYTIPYTFCYIPDNNGDYAYCTQSARGYFSPTDDIVCLQSLRTNHGIATGKVGSLTTLYHATSGVIDTETYVFAPEFVTETLGLTEMYKTPQFGQYIIPLEYTYSVTGEYSTLYSTIPILVIVAIVLAAVGMIYTHRE